MPKIVNLSCIHTLYPISKSLSAFSTICDRYSLDCLRYMPFFQRMSNLVWVNYQFKTHFKSLIIPYKSGALTTEEFLGRLIDIFSFLEADGLSVPASELERIQNNPKIMHNDNFQMGILEEAWNKIIGLEEDHKPRLAKLMEDDEPVYLISNTNELNIFLILQLLKEANRGDIVFYDKIDLSVMEDDQPVAIADNLYLCVSYRYQLFKTLEQTKSVNPNSTMSLLKHLVTTTFAEQVDKITLISQFNEDLLAAKDLGITADNIFHADKYFAAPESSLQHS